MTSDKQPPAKAGPDPYVVKIPANRLRYLLIGSLRALQIMQDRGEVQAELQNELTNNGNHPLPTDAELDELIRTLNGNCLFLVVHGAFRVPKAFKRTSREVP